MPEFAPPGPGARHPGQRGAGRRRPRGRSARRSPPPSGCSTAPATPTPSAARPATTPAPTSSAATATSTTPPPRSRRLRDGGLAPVGILDLDLHYPNGTSALVERMGRAPTLHSLHAAPVTNVAARHGAAAGRRRTRRRLRREPGRRRHLPAARSRPRSTTLAADSAALVVSLGYDTVDGDPHGGWRFGPEIFAEIGRLLAASGLPVCVVQEGGYSLDALAACSHAFAAGLLGGRAR